MKHSYLVQRLRNCAAYETAVDPRKLNSEAADALELVDVKELTQPSKGTILIERIFAVQSAKFGDRQTRTDGVVAHIHKEADEAKANPGDLVEWADIILLAIDGYRRNGGKADELLPLIARKLAIVEAREYLDPYATPDDVALEHDRGPDGRGLLAEDARDVE